MRFGVSFAAVAACIGLASSQAWSSEMTTPLRADQVRFVSLFKEMVETNTTASSGSCTRAAEQVAARLKAAGYADADIHLFADPERPQDGGIVATLPGRDPHRKAILLLAHLDVVEAHREDWTRDPFKLVEADGNFYGRGVFDDKYHAAIWADLMVRYKEEGYRPDRTVKMALTCGEESSGLHGIDWVLQHHRDWVDAEFALNEGGVGESDEHGTHVLLGVQTAEKVYQDFKLEVTNPGGHSSRPVPDNAIYHLANALVKIQAYRFPVEFNDTTRDFFGRMALTLPPAQRAPLEALLKNPKDETARALVETDPDANAILHTNCVATMLDAGHATNALPQRAKANVNCRIFPGSTTEGVRQTLEQVIGDPKVAVKVREIRNIPSAPPPLDPKVLGPAEKLAAQMWPGVPQLRLMSAGATDGAFLTPVGIPTYGISGDFGDPDGDGVHGLNERIRVKVLLDSRDYLYRLMKIYADQAD